MKIIGTSVLALLFASMLLSQKSQAVSVSVYEEIKDLEDDTGSVRNLSRTRFDGTSLVTESSDSTIISQNSVSSAFGISNTSDVSYSHKTDWLSDNAFTSAKLEIWHKSVNNGAGTSDDDNVTVELSPILLGALNDNGVSSSTVFNIDGAAINAYLADNTLSIYIDKKPNGSDSIEITRSRLTLTYETTSVPDGGTTLGLFGCGLAGLVCVRRKLKA